MDQMEQQDEFNLNISPAAVAFVVLAVAMVLVGLYVTNQDIETTGVTADEARLTLRTENAETGLAVRYPEAWEAAADGDALTIRPRATDTDVAIINLAHRFTSIEVALAELIAGRDVTAEPLELEGITGQTFTMTEQLSGETVDVRYAVFENEADDVFVGTLTTTAGNLSEHERDFELMLPTVDYLLSLTNLAVRENVNFAIPYPQIWTDQRNLQAPDAITVVENPDSPTTGSIQLQVLPGQAFGVTGEEVDVLQTIISGIVEAPDVNLVSDFNTDVFQRYEAIAVDVELAGSENQRLRVVVVDLSNGNYLLAIMSSTLDRFEQLAAILDAMLQRFEYDGLISPIERLNGVRDRTPSEPSAEEEVPADAEDTDEATETDTEAPAEDVTPPDAPDAEDTETEAPADDTATETEADTADVTEDAATRDVSDRVDEIRNREPTEPADAEQDQTVDETDATSEDDEVDTSAETDTADAMDTEATTDDADTAAGDVSDQVDDIRDGDDETAATDDEQAPADDTADTPADEGSADGGENEAPTATETDDATDRVNDIRDREPTAADTAEPDATASDTETPESTEEDDATAPAEDDAETAVEPLPLVEMVTRENIGFAIAVPENWTDQSNPQLPERITLVETPNDPTSNFYRFDVVPAEAFGLTGEEEDPLQVVTAAIVEAPGITRLTDYSAITRAGFEGVETEIRPEGDESQQAHVLVFDLTDGNYLVVLLLSDVESYPQLDATLGAMFETLEYTPVPDTTEE